MILLVILAALGVQRYLHFSGASYQFNWRDRYVAWLLSKSQTLGEQHPYVGLAILILPVTIAVSLVFAFLRPGMPTVGYLFLLCLLLWYLMDAREWSRIEKQTARSLVDYSYNKVFALIFWFTVMGPMGLMLYVVSAGIVNGCQLPEAERTRLMGPAKAWLAWLDWLPIRLLGLTFGLVGNFGAVLHLWLPHLTKQATASHTYLQEWAKAALQVDKAKVPAMEAVTPLLDRSLLVWLVVLALFSVGSWIG